LPGFGRLGAWEGTEWPAHVAQRGIFCRLSRLRSFPNRLLAHCHGAMSRAFGSENRAMSTTVSTWTKGSPLLLSVLRIVAAFVFMQHGAQKLFGFPGGDHLHLISSSALFTLVPGLAGILEFGGGFLLLIGLFARPVAFILSGEMAFAYFMVHFKINHVWPILNHGNEAVLCCFLFLYLSAAGPGPWSFDRALRRA
jgi:putative oxidoreductase